MFYVPSAESSVRLCNFHREKAWVEWCSKKDHAVAAHRDQVLAMLRRIAHATDEDGAHRAIEQLRVSPVWQSSPPLQRWFEDKWLSEIHVGNLKHSATVGCYNIVTVVYE